VRKEPKPITFEDFADELLAELQPRALIILSSAHIDAQLRNMIESFLLQKASKSKEPDELFDGDSPLSSFSSRIKISLRLGLIDVPLANALNKLRDVRNQAAHWVSFGIADSPLRDQIRDLQAVVVSRRSYKLTVSKFFDHQDFTEIESLQAVLLTLGALLGSIHGGIPEKCLSKTQKPVTFD